MVQNVLKEKALKYKETKGYIKCYGKLGIKKIISEIFAFT